MMNSFPTKPTLDIEIASSTDESSITNDDADDSSLESSSTTTTTSTTAAVDATPIVLPHTGPKTVLVTGGAGFIGSSVAHALLQRGDTVVILDEINDYYDIEMKHRNLKWVQSAVENDDENIKNRLTIVQGDICDGPLLERLFAEHQIQWVCHLAARAGVRPSIQDPYVYIHSNIEGTTRLLEVASKYRCQNFCFASSSSVYGGSPHSVFSEDDTVDRPVSPYAASKKACELLAYTFHNLYGLPVSGLRFFTVYGPRGRPDMAPFKFIDRIRRGQAVQQFGDGSSSRDYTYIDDIVDGVVRSLDRPYEYQIFNLGKGDGTSLREFLDLVQDYTQRTADIQILPDQPGDVPYTCANVAKAQHLLGYRAQVPFREGIRRTVLWHQAEYKLDHDNDDNDSSDGDEVVNQRMRKARTTAAAPAMALPSVQSNLLVPTGSFA